MAKPIVGDSVAFAGPPIELITSNKELYDFLLMIYDHIYGLGGSGSLNDDNVSGVTVSHDATVSQTAYQHHGAGLHANIDQAAAQVDLGGTVAESVVSVTTADAELIYDQPEVDLINELKSSVNQLVVDLNASIAKINAVTADLDALKSKLRASGVMAT